LINGIANEPFLFGDGSVRFSLELKSAASAFHNTLGVYTIGSDGTIADVRVLFNDTLNVAGAARTVDLGTPADGARFAFFLIQDGSDAYGRLPDDLTFVAQGSTVPANVLDGVPILHSASRGDLVATPVFHSDPIFNPPLSEGTLQVLSGVAPGGRELLIGFEDVSTVSGDNDFQDVVVGIRNLNDDALIL
jgi:serralysin